MSKLLGFLVGNRMNNINTDDLICLWKEFQFCMNIENIADVILLGFVIRGQKAFAYKWFSKLFEFRGIIKVILKSPTRNQLFPSSEMMFSCIKTSNTINNVWKCATTNNIFYGGKSHRYCVNDKNSRWLLLCILYSFKLENVYEVCILCVGAHNILYATVLYAIF